MKKRILSFLLALLMVVEMIPAQVFATEGMESMPIPTETVNASTMEAAANADVDPVETTIAEADGAPADNCPYCDDTLNDAGETVHTENCNTNFAVDASGEVGKSAAFSNVWAPALYTNEKPTAGFDYENGLLEAAYDYDNAPLVTITDWYWDVSGPVLWYRVAPLEGESLPDGITTDSWILQKYTNEDDSANMLYFVDLGILGKTIAFEDASALLYDGIDGNTMEVDGAILRNMVVTDLSTDGVDVWYRVGAAVGETWPEVYALYQYVRASDVKIVEPVKPESVCDICGKPGCTALHFVCVYCGEYDCGKTHLYFSKCEKYDCDITHVFCGICGELDCGKEHESIVPVTTPVIPEQPELTEGADVSVVDAFGNAVTEEGYMLIHGKQASFSAWSALEDAEHVNYQWQIRYDSRQNLWADIQGQTGKGILVSPAMFLNVLDEENATEIRCVMTSGAQSQTSLEIPVHIEQETAILSIDRISEATSENAAVVVAEDEENKVNLIINYLFLKDSSIAASPWAASLPKGTAYSNTETPITVPTIAGYKPKLDVAGSGVTLDGNELTLNLSAEQLNSDVTVDVWYEPDYVKVMVYHYHQNINNDNYTLADTDIIENQYKTEQTVGDVHKTYSGFYNLLYEKPVVAADGSTVVEVYYNRYYYLMTFDLDGGYGVKPIYARYGADIEIQSPTKAGHAFNNWTPAVPATMPVNGGTYQAIWTATTAQYTVSYWIVNDDGTRTLIGTHINTGVPGSLVSGKDDLGTDDGYICNEESEHVHSAACYSCNHIEHNHTKDCFTNIYSNDPGANGKDVIRELGDNEPESGYVYVVQVKGGNFWPKIYLNGTYYAITGTDDTTDPAAFSGIIEGEPLGTATKVFSNETLIVTKYKAKTDCGSEQHIHAASCTLTCSQHEHDPDKCYFQDTKYLEYIASDSTDNVAYKTETDIVINGDGTSIVNVYYQYKKYTLRFYYAATEGGSDTNNDGVNDTGFSSIKIVGGTTYPFGKHKDNNYSTPDTSNDEALLEHEYFNYKSEWGSISALPTLNARGLARNYTTGAETYSQTQGTSDKSVTYHYISFDARYGDDISGLWPCGVFNSATRTDKTNANGWAGKEAFVSAWNGEHHVKYTQDNSNQTIKGVYEKLDENLLFDPIYPDEQVVSYLCFWENGANIGWSVPELYRYNIYLEAYTGQDVTGKSPIIRDGKTYYLSDSYETCDNSTIGEQTQVSLTGYDKVFFDKARDGYSIAPIKDSNPAQYFEYKEMKGTDDASLLQQSGYFDNRLYQEGYEVYFYYNAKRHPLIFWNHDDFLQDGSGSQAAYNEPLTKHFEGITVNGVEYEGANDLVVKPEYYPKSLEPDAYEFEGWYLSPTFEPETKVIPANITMPNEPMRVYAKWVPIKHTVKFFIDNQATQTIPEQLGDAYAKFNKTVLHGTTFATTSEEFVPRTTDDENHPYKEFEFVGWFYEEDGEEKAFDPVNMPVTQDLDLYAKWSLNILCPYIVYFAYDKDGDNVVDPDEYVADPITGSTLAGNSVTIDAKGNTSLYPDYQNSYFPNVASHNFVLMPQYDNDGNQISTVEVFWYTLRETVPYTVRYLDKETGKPVEKNGTPVANKTVSDNTKAVVTENFVVVPGYKPDAFQKSLPVVPNQENVITFYYTKDTVHAPVQVIHYIENLGTGYTVYQETTDLNGIIGSDYTASILNITGFDFDHATANDVTIESGQQITSQVPETGLQLKLYYKREVYAYRVRYLEFGTDEELAPDKFGGDHGETARYNEVVTEYAIDIEKDMDGDGKFEDFQLYEATNDPQTATIKDDSTVITFYYVRCTQNLSVTKTVTGEGADPDQLFHFTLTSTATDFGGENSAYSYTVGSDTYTAVAQNDTLSFSLKKDQTAIFQKLPTAKYTVSEQYLPVGYYCEGPVQETTLTKDASETITVENTYAPANLTITKTVTVEEIGTNTPERSDFEFTIAFPDSVTPAAAYNYVIKDKDGKPVADENGNNTRTATVTNGQMKIYLEKDQTAEFLNLPVGAYTVTETDYSAQGYDSNYKVNNAADYTEGEAAPVTLVKNETQAVEFMNRFPVGDLIIEKTVTKEFYGTEWIGDTFTFTVERTTEGRPLIIGNQYRILLDDVAQDANIVVGDDNKLTVSIPFTKAEADAVDWNAENANLMHKLTIKNLPAGTYQVTEAEDAVYVQAPSNRIVSGLVIPAEEVKASFTNTVKRKSGGLYLEKELIPAEGYIPNELPQGTKFSFEIELLEQPPVQDTAFKTVFPPKKYKILNTSNELVDGDDAPTSITMKNGKFTVEIQAGQSVTVEGVPEGRYRITEATLPYYANSFAHKEDGNWIKKPSTSTADGQMYTEIAVKPNTTAEVKCTNTYPVYRAELIIQKLVTKEYDRDTLPDAKFTFTVTLAEEDRQEYNYTVYDADGNNPKTGKATVENKVFVIQDLKAGQYVVVEEMPVCGYTVTESGVSAEASIQDYNISYQVYQSTMGTDASTKPNTSGEVIESYDTSSVSRTFAAGHTDTLVFTNQYKRHLGELKITKQLAKDSVNTGEKFLFRITGANGFSMSIALEAGQSQTIFDLPLGEYTVTEDTSWNWRYNLNSSNGVKVTLRNGEKAPVTAEVTFENAYSNSSWLTDTDVETNNFEKSTSANSN